tara:strand:+ start:271 stop:1236 length:966 start_codon:yes stop_codon:yes gene_type:complete
MKECLDRTEVDELIFKEFVKNGHAESNGRKIWDIAERRFLYLTPELCDKFLELKKMPNYKKRILDKEVDLLKDNARKIKKEVGEEAFNLLDFFCGDGSKAIEIVKMLDKNIKVRYCPVGVCDYLTKKAVANMKAQGFENVVEYKPMIAQGDGRTLRFIDKDLKKGEFGKNVILILGTVLGSFQINEYLFELKKDMGKDDLLIVGNNLRIGEPLADLENYKHRRIGDWVGKIVEGLGLTKDDVTYDARFGNSRVEMFFKVNVDKTVKHDGHILEFKKGDEILAAVLNKYKSSELANFFEMYFSDVRFTTDEDKCYALAVCRK